MGLSSQELLPSRPIQGRPGVITTAGGQATCCPRGLTSSPAVSGPSGLPMAAYTEMRVCSFEEFNQAVKQHEGKPIFVFFVGSLDAEGKSWCPLCVEAEPVIREGLKHTRKECVFIYCQIGDKPSWRDPNNDFRRKLSVMSLPTLQKYGTPRKLVDSECQQANLVQMFFGED